MTTKVGWTLFQQEFTKCMEIPRMGSVSFSKEIVVSLEKSRHPWIKQWNPALYWIELHTEFQNVFQRERVPKPNRKSACPDVGKIYCPWLPEITVSLVCLPLSESSSSATITWFGRDDRLFFKYSQPRTHPEMGKLPGLFQPITLLLTESGHN